ncbi:MAG: hypothetical protein ACLUHA_11155 [Bacteroides stercoris]
MPTGTVKSTFIYMAGSGHNRFSLSLLATNVISSTPSQSWERIEIQIVGSNDTYHKDEQWFT